MSHLGGSITIECVSRQDLMVNGHQRSLKMRCQRGEGGKGVAARTCMLIAETPEFQFQTQGIKQDLQLQEEELIQEIDAEDVGAMTPCGRLAAKDSAPTPNATFLIQLRNQLIPNPRNQA